MENIAMTSIPGLSPDTSLLVVVVFAVIGLIVLVARFKLNAFLALILASIFVGLCSGMPLPKIARSFQEGVGGTLGFIAVVVGLGTMLGKMLAECGGAEVVAASFIRCLGTHRLHWAMLAVGFIVGLPVFFGVGLVLLVPILFTLVRDTKAPLLFLGIPLVAGLSVSHGLIPPHPGPMVAIEKLGADVGRTILYATLVGIPTAVIAGPIFGRFISPMVRVEGGGIGSRLVGPAASAVKPGFGLTLLTILLPVILMLAATLAEVMLEKTSPLRAWAIFIGSPLVALLAAVLFSFYSFGRACGIGREQILKFTDECVGPAASIILVVGAGGGFSKVLEHGGAADAISGLARGLDLSPILLGWIVAALIRVAVGSATVAITLGSAIMVPIAEAHPGVAPELLVIALGAGSLVLSHLNDGGFWFVKEYFNLTVPQTLKTWTVMETIIAVVALVLTLLLDLIL
jgi:GntP family gluconate:H+ symporter